MLHRAILGSMERFIGILIEHHAGAFPLWLSPLQAVVMRISRNIRPITPRNCCGKTTQGGWPAGALRICVMRKLTIKYANIACRKLPYQIVVGDKEKAAGLVAVRARGGQDLGQMSLETLLERLRGNAHARAGAT
jgi:threonyl-tRNA synthetase